MATPAASDRVRKLLDRHAPADTGLSAQETADAAIACLDALVADSDRVDTGLSARTVRYYQQRGIVTPPDGQTSTARYGRQQVLEIVVTRLANGVRRQALDAIADEIETSDVDALIDWIADMVPQPDPAPSTPAADVAIRPSRLARRVRVEIAAGVVVELPNDHPALGRPDLGALMDRWAADLLS